MKIMKIFAKIDVKIFAKTKIVAKIFAKTKIEAKISTTLTQKFYFLV
jgi:hypothetical protein